MIAAAAAITVVAVTLTPATAADTSTTFTVTATAGLAVSAPENAALSSAAPGGQAVGALGNMSVNDQRSETGTTWIARVTLSTAFTTGAGAPSQTISAANVVYDPRTAINPVNGPFTPGTPGDLDSTPALVAFSRDSGDGANSVTWNPEVTVNVPAGNVSGDYTGTIRHSVA
ncbi:hypothetical protein SLUN_34725 [Streptomyces lunaelactis]|uniref:WxL domain-containing protein n=1 Tax=Streptomyces lunaelactis TaxID=1535768 RepID=A0A2R4TBU3_9ACTN|nr:hypothetical protein SLUN_34725 [Streptomyces lunaelactis]